MKGPPKPRETGLCAVCGKRQAPSGRRDTYDFKTILAKHGIAGDKAHPECVGRICFENRSNAEGQN